jgi:malonyl CoA-acyl carrier protein transacylase/phosphopantetheinyl transferase (holo-ACP synthase)
VCAAHVWDNELFIIRGEDLKDLSKRLQHLINFLEVTPNVVLKDLAFTLNTSTASSNGSTLAVIGGADLRAKLIRAAERLADPACQQIHDITGIYYAKQGLHREGKLAFLFPGEGAQYPNMLADLRAHFPSVRDFYSQYDQLTPDGNSISQILFLPDNATDAERKRADDELKKLSAATFYVLMADWALFFLLSKLGLKADSTAGHSMGELAALGTAGWVNIDAAFFDRVNKTMEELDNQAIAGKVEEATLLAVGSGKNAVREILKQLGEVADSSVYVAMDNCPHQSVIVGPKAPMELLEEEFKKRSIVSERLPFSRPYHTKLFEPMLAHLDTMFDEVVFSPSQTCVYSCSTAKPFPADPAEIRQLAVSHWAAPVEFTKMIENMYADGVRIFVEVGPRGNLTAFVADILRGKSFTSIASNVQRRSGITQIHHLAGQLIAHGVPLDLNELYCHRSPKKIFGFEQREPEKHPVLEKQQAETKITNRSKVLSKYFNVMEQFLDLQGECMKQFLALKNGKPAATVKTAPPPQNMPLIGDIVQHEPGKLLVMRRKMDMKEDLFAADHTVGGRTLSRVDPEQYGLPVIPGTFSLEMMAEAASYLIPGKVVLSLNSIRLKRWIVYDEENPTVVEITAKAIEKNNFKPQVEIEIRELGPASSPFESPKSVVSGRVLLGDMYPEPPLAEAFVLTNDRPPTTSLDIMRQNLFHGPLFQGVFSTDRFGDEGIESKVHVLPREKLFSSKKEPQFIFDPVLADCCMHPFVTWHLEQPDQSGRILLPVEIGSVELFGPPPQVGENILSRGKIVDSSSRHFTHEVEAIKADGKLLFRLRGVKFWRFYVPFGKINFHGPKDEYFLSNEWGQTFLPTTSSQTHSHCMRLDPPADLKQPGMRLVTARITLSPQEISQFSSMKASPERLDEWLFGRIVAKDAIRSSWFKYRGERLFPADIEIVPDSHGRPIGRMRGGAIEQSLPTVSISHTDGIIVALAAFHPHVGIDIEKIKPREKSFEEIAFDSNERNLLDAFGQDRNEGIARFWCAKEAVGKALGRGLVEGPRTLVIREVDKSRKTIYISLGAKLSQEFPQFKDALITAHTDRDKDLIVATTFCERFER